MSKTFSNLEFINDEFLNQSLLTVENCLHVYFRSSPFYDRNCLNEMLLMRGNLNIAELDSEDGDVFDLSFVQTQTESLTKEECRKIDNFPKVVHPGFCIIDKIRRKDRKEDLLARFYIVNGRIYQAPIIFDLLSAQIRSAMFYIREAVKEASSAYKWTLENGYQRKDIAIVKNAPIVLFESEMNDLRQSIDEEFRLQSDLFSLIFPE